MTTPEGAKPNYTGNGYSYGPEYEVTRTSSVASLNCPFLSLL